MTFANSDSDEKAHRRCLVTPAAMRTPFSSA